MKKKVANYSEQMLYTKLVKFFWLKLCDFWERLLRKERLFEEYGMTMFCGKQGAGKTISMVEYLERMRLKYPKCLIYTNFGYVHESGAFKDWQDFFSIRNGTDGVIFAIDEIQNEFDTNAWRSFPEALLSEITQQRKQRIKIVATSQVFTRVAKPLREQTQFVVDCKTHFGRWTATRCYDAYEYQAVMESPERKGKLRAVYKKQFVQDAGIRGLYDSYAKIVAMSKAGFLERDKRYKDA